MRPRPATAVRRMIWTGGVTVALVATVVAVPSQGGDRASGYVDPLRPADTRSTGAQSGALPGDRSDDGHGHDHADPATENAISRAGDVSTATEDPTTPRERQANEAYAAADRTSPDPALTRAAVGPPRPANPASRFAMANGCYALTHAGRWVRRTDDGLAATAGRRRRAEPFFFKPTRLGSYLLYGTDRDFLSVDGTVTMADRPSEDAEWILAEAGERFTLRLGRQRRLAVGDDRTLVTASRAARFDIRRVRGCTRYPEAGINISGRPFAGASRFQEVRGYVDAHTHGMAFEFLGGGAHCGRPWHEYGAPYALVDCPDHRTGTNPLEAFLSGEPRHDPVGWPTFVDWPAPNSLTHEGTYYRWLERAWRGGQRLFVNLLVENNQLCELYPFGPGGDPAAKNSCDDMDSVRLQARRMRQFEDYVDAQFGGPGRGFYRIVTSPWQARRVINAGRMAVVMGIETSVPFGCTFKTVSGGGGAECDRRSVDRQLDRVHAMGVRQMELVNKFDNALSGVAGDAGAVGVAVNNAQFRETESYWDMRTCDPADTPHHDRNQYAAPAIDAEQQDALFGAVSKLFAAGGLPAPPLYPPPNHCNERGLTSLGEHVIAGLAERHMLFDPDHMSVKARNAALDQVEDLGYSGVLSSHSWSTEDAYPRIYELGGFVAPYAGDSMGFVDKWREHLGWADERYYFGFGFGADMNGLGAQGNPRGADVPDPVTYPFQGLGGVTVKKQHAGERVYDINVDGVAQYGLYPDWVEDLRRVADSGQGDGDAIVRDMARGAEAYLQTWERAEGIAPDSCRNPGLRQDVDTVRGRVVDGMTTREVMEALGQPYQRLGNRYTVCATAPGEPRVEVQVTFSRGGRVTGLARQG